MEIFVEFVLPIALSLIFSFFLAKIISVSSSASPNCEYDLVSGLKPCKDFIQNVVTCERDSKGEKRDGFAAKVVEGDDLGKSKPENILPQGVGSCDYVKIDENQNEVLKEEELPDSMGRVVGACACSESEKFLKLETGLTKDEVGVAKSEEIEVLENKCGYEIDEASKNEEDDDGYKCSIFNCKEILVEESNFFESDKIVKIEAESTKTEVCVTRSEEMEVLKSNCDDEIDEANKIEGHFGKEIMVDKSNFIESENIAKIESQSTKTTKVGMARSEEIEVLESKCDNEIGEGNKNEEDDIEEVLFDEDDDWEGIERTELERLFGATVAFVGNKCNADRISSIGTDVKMQLYGLHKIATVGPCHESQPMALKVSARANWNAWKQLGSMTPEIAMEQYVTILSRSIPGCIQDDNGGDIKHVSADAEACSKLTFDLNAYQTGQLCAIDKRNVDDDHTLRVEGF